MDYLVVIFGLLGVLSFGFQLWKHKRSQKENKMLVESLATINQHLENIKDKVKKLKS